MFTKSFFIPAAVLTLTWLVLPGSDGHASDVVDLSLATVIHRAGELPPAEMAARTILIEEVSRRTQLTWPAGSNTAPHRRSEIYLGVKQSPPGWQHEVPASVWNEPLLSYPEAFSVRFDDSKDQVRLFIIGADARGLMYGVGYLLRQMRMMPGKVEVDRSCQIASRPDKPLRGHQIGYRPRANSWDAWTVQQFDQYFRDLVVFGANAVENIPFQDNDPHPLMKLSRDEMNIEFARLCIKYDLQHWVWVPVEFDVAAEGEKAAEFLKRQEAFYAACPRLDAIFVPGGDPGKNPSSSLMPYLARMAEVIRKRHGNAKIWVSLQGFHGKDIDDFYTFIDTEQPDWLGGLVMGPSSPPMNVTRERLPKRYKLRWYPDITHNVRCQYPIPWLDPAWGLTVGREGVNPRPTDFAGIYRNEARLTDGFISYSDGIHDDFNKNLWSALAWNESLTPRDFAREYSRYFFGSEVDEMGADGLQALEMNLRGPADSSGAVQGTLALWVKMDQMLPSNRNWRFDMHLFRAYCDAYTQRRLAFETKLEAQALEILASAKNSQIETAVENVLVKLTEADVRNVHAEWLNRIEHLADKLFDEIGYQTSVPKYGASGFERGCMLDYIRYPLNNRWWIEDRLGEIQSLPDIDQKLQRIARIVNWEHPGPGSYYEALGHVGKSHHMIKILDAADAARSFREIASPPLPVPTQRNIGPMRNGLRMSFHVYQDELPAMEFNALDPDSKYVVRLFAQRESPLEIDGVPAKKIRTGDQYDQVTEQEFEVPATALSDGRIVLTWTRMDESHLNWRERHYVTDLWILKQPN